MLPRSAEIQPLFFRFVTLLRESWSRVGMQLALPYMAQGPSLWAQAQLPSGAGPCWQARQCCPRVGPSGALAPRLASPSVLLQGGCAASGPHLPSSPARSPASAHHLPSSSCPPLQHPLAPPNTHRPPSTAVPLTDLPARPPTTSWQKGTPTQPPHQQQNTTALGVPV